MNAGLMLGVDFEISKRILLGAGLDYNFNVMNRQSFQSQYGLPGGVKVLEEIDYTLIKVSAKNDLLISQLNSEKSGEMTSGLPL